MKVWKPLEGFTPRDNKQDLPCWFFEGVDIPNYDYDTLNWNSIQGEILANEDIYAKREVARYHLNKDNIIFKELKETVRNIIIDLRDNHPIRGLEFSWPIDAWNDNVINVPNSEHLEIDLKRDNEGFNMGQHYDNRNTKWTMIMNLRDNKESTRFNIGEALNTGNNEMVYGPKTKGSGLFYFNHRELLHSIGPITENGRLTLFYMNMVTK